MCAVDMFIYINLLKLPDHGVKWGPGFGLVCTSWVVLFPVAAFFLWIAKGSRRLAEDPNEEPPATCLTVSLAMHTPSSPAPLQ